MPLIRAVTQEELRQAVFQLGATKSPGPDGLNGLFYQHYWDILKEDLFGLVQHFFCTGVLQHDLDIIVHTLWQIWKARNSFVFRRAHPDPIQVVRTALANALTDRRLYAASPASQRRSFPSDRVWHPPIPGTWKVNIDGAFIPASSEGSMASITRDHAGRIVDSFSSHVAASSARGIGLPEAGGCGQQILPSAMGASLSAC